MYVEKPLSHDIYEARQLTLAAQRYKVVTQMGNQGASGDGVRQLKDWVDAGVIGKVNKVYCWTDRPSWPQGIMWPTTTAEIPKELDWDLWLGSAQEKPYVDKLVPFNWRGWWDFGTGAIGDMGCHLVEVPFSILGLDTPTEVQCSVGSIYVDEFKRGYFPDSCPPSSHVTMTFKKTRKTKDDLEMHWMDGGIKPARPEELGPNEPFGANGVLFEGTKGKMVCDVYGANPRLLPLSRTNEVRVKQRAERVPGGVDGHYWSWVEACIAGYGKKELSSPFEIAGPLTETLLIANLAIRGTDVQIPRADGKGFSYPGRDIKLLWDKENLRVTNFDDVNQFVKREYRQRMEFRGIVIKYSMENNKIRVLVVGCGNMGASHATAYHQLEGFEICGLVSTGNSKVALNEKLGGSYALFTDFEEALNTTKPDAVCISTYPDTHEDFAIRSFENGCHVFIEKPLAASLEGAIELLMQQKDTIRRFW